MDNKFLNTNGYYKDLYDMFNSSFFKSEMDINIKQILLERKQKCEFVLNANIDGCFTDGRRIVIGAMQDIRDLEPWQSFGLIKALVGHEAAHIRWSNFNELKAFKNQIEGINFDINFALSISNAIEDGRVERLLCNDLKGFRKYINHLNLILIYKDGKMCNSSRLANIFNLILFISKTATLPLNFDDIFTNKERDFIYKKIIPYIKKGINSNSSKGMFSSTLSILELINKEYEDLTQSIVEDRSTFDKFSDPQYNTSEEDIPNELDLLDNQYNDNKESYLEDEQNSIEGELNKLDNDCVNEPSGKKGDNSDLGSGFGSSGDIFRQDLSDIINSIKDKISEDFESINKLNEKDNSHGQKNSNKDDYFENINLENINNVYPSRIKELNFKYKMNEEPYKPYPQEYLFSIKMLEKQFSKILISSHSFSKNQKKGRLDTSKLWRVDSIYSQNIFYKKNILNKSDYGVYILIDFSGSMSYGNKYKEAISTAIKVEGALMNINNVKVKTVGFNYRCGTNMEVFKDFNERKSRTSNALDIDYLDGSNRDGFAIRVALDDLKNNGGDNNLLIVISDGRPSWDLESPLESMKDVKDAVHEGRKIATIMSIFINDGPINQDMKDSFYYMYEDKGTIMVDVDSQSEDLTNNIILYLKHMFKTR